MIGNWYSYNVRISLASCSGSKLSFKLCGGEAVSFLTKSVGTAHLTLFCLNSILKKKKNN